MIIPMGFKPIAKALWNIQFRIRDNQSIVPWCEYTKIEAVYLLDCINEALNFWNLAFPSGEGLIFSPRFIFNWGSQPELEYQIYSWIRLKKNTQSIWAGQAVQNISVYSNECTKGFINLEGFDGPNYWTKFNGVDKYPIPKKDVLSWMCKHELGHIVGLGHVQGKEYQNNIMYSGNRDIPLATELGAQDLEMLKIQYPKEFGLLPKYKHIWNKLYWKIN